jgi:hypothetical protein
VSERTDEPEERIDDLDLDADEEGKEITERVTGGRRVITPS